MRRWGRRYTRTGLERDGGATLVETSFVMALVLIPLMLGILEFGLLFKNWLMVSNASREAANVVSAAADNPIADIAGLRVIEGRMTEQNLDALQSVRIENATDASRGTTYFYDPAIACKWNPCPDPDGAYVQPGWVPSSRNVVFDNLDTVAVTLTFQHDYVTGIIGNSVDLTRTITNRLEPQIFTP